MAYLVLDYQTQLSALISHGSLSDKVNSGAIPQAFKAPI